MTGIIVLAALVITVVALLELSHRRHAEVVPRRSLQGIDDRDVARTRLDLLALAGRAEPFVHKPFTVKGHWREIGYGDTGQSSVRLAG